MSDLSRITAERAGAVGAIIVGATRIEALLRQVVPDAAVSGLHNLIEAAGDRLPDELRRRLHHIGAVRNRAAHEAEFNVEFFDLAAFNAEIAAAETGLREVITCGAAPEAKFDVAVEREWYSNLLRKLTLLGYFPLLGVANCLRLVVEAVYRSCGVVLLVAFMLAGVPLMVQGVREERRAMVIIGAALELGCWLITLLLARRRSCGLPRSFNWIPGLQLIYLGWWWLGMLDWGRLVAGLLGWGLLALIGHFAWTRQWELMLYTLAAQWIFSVITSWLFRPIEPVE